jgi:hypothetical protein
MLNGEAIDPSIHFTRLVGAGQTEARQLAIIRKLGKAASRV